MILVTLVNAVRSVSIYVVRREFSFFFVFTFLLSLRTHQKSSFSVAIGSQERRIRKYSFKREIKISRPNLYLLFFDLSWELLFVYRKPERKGDFRCILLFWTFETIKMRIARKFSRYSFWTTDFIYISDQLMLNNESYRQLKRSINQ